MPTYEYRCGDCGDCFALSESLAEHEAATPKCPKCGSLNVIRAISSFFAKTSRKS